MVAKAGAEREGEMRWISILLIVFAFPTFAQISQSYVVRDSVTNCVNVRIDHDDGASSIACLIAGTAVTVVDVVPYWREITFGDSRGWIAKKFIEPAATPPVAPDTSIPADAFLEIHFVDVGQGDAIWIQTHDDGIDGNGRFEGHSIVIDGGPYSSDIENPFRGYIEDVGHHGAVIEALIVTHPHSDHYRGAETISRHFDIQHYYDPGYPSNKSGYLSFLAAMQGTDSAAPRAETVHIGLDNFGVLDWGRELDAEFLYAWPGSNQGLGSGSTAENNASIVLRLQYGEHTFLFMGDAEGKDRGDSASTPRYVEKILLNNPPDRLKATVLKIAHHGSETSSTIPFIQAVDPEIVVVQSGRHAFGGTFLPDSSTLERYCLHNSNIRIYRTDQNDEAAGLLGRDALDNDHIVIRSNGVGAPTVTAMDGGTAIQIEACQF